MSRENAVFLSVLYSTYKFIEVFSAPFALRVIIGIFYLYRTALSLPRRQKCALMTRRGLLRTLMRRVHFTLLVGTSSTFIVANVEKRQSSWSPCLPGDRYTSKYLDFFLFYRLEKIHLSPPATLRSTPMDWNRPCTRCIFPVKILLRPTR